MKRIFIICTVRGASAEHVDKLNQYTHSLEGLGHKVHLPHRDTDQVGSGFEICNQNKDAIEQSDEVHIFYNELSQGTHFDMGVAFALKKKIVLPESLVCELPGKSFKKMLNEWAIK